MRIRVKQSRYTIARKRMETYGDEERHGDGKWSVSYTLQAIDTRTRPAATNSDNNSDTESKQKQFSKPLANLFLNVRVGTIRESPRSLFRYLQHH